MREKHDLIPTPVLRSFLADSTSIPSHSMIEV